MSPVGLHTLLGDHAVTGPLKRGDLVSSRLTLDFADVKVPNKAFKRVVRDLEFDVAELAIITFLMAKARGAALTLLPAVVMARPQHPFLVHNAERGPLTPGDLAGRRIGIRSYTVTTAVWIRSFLADDFGIDPDTVQWVTLEDAHVAGFTDPPNVVRSGPGQDLTSMLLAGEIDAAVIGALPDDPRIKPVFADPLAASREWQRKYNAIPVNHLVVVKTALCEAQPDIVHALYELLKASKRAAGLPKAGEPDMYPFGIEENRRNLEIAIDITFRQGLIPRRLSVDELFDGMRFA